MTINKKMEKETTQKKTLQNLHNPKTENLETTIPSINLSTKEEEQPEKPADAGAVDCAVILFYQLKEQSKKELLQLKMERVLAFLRRLKLGIASGRVTALLAMDEILLCPKSAEIFAILKTLEASNFECIKAQLADASLIDLLGKMEEEFGEWERN
jgi:hypothetical protein